MKNNRQDGQIFSRENKVIVSGNMPIGMFKSLCGTLHNVISMRGYRDVILDFSGASKIFESFVVPVLPIISAYAHDGVGFSLVLPADRYLKSIFIRANWAHYICPDVFEKSDDGSTTHVSAMQFRDADEQSKAVDRIMDVVLGSITHLTRGHLKALYWSLTEITDNVLNHSESRVGGFVQATTFSGTDKIEFIVSDAGMGIPRSLGMRPEIALEQAIKEGVTKDKTTNQGNGLFGTYQVAVLSNGEFEINSDVAYLVSKGGNDLRVRRSNTPYKGTSVRCVVDCSKQNLLEEALRFKGKPHDPPFDYVDDKFERSVADGAVFSVKDHSSSLGSRKEGVVIRTKILNILGYVSPGTKVTIDFDGIYVVSSSFADEVFGRLFASMGPLEFMSRLEFRNIDPTVKSLIDRSISQRFAQAVK